MNKTAAAAIIAATVALGATACNLEDSSNVKGTVTSRTGGAVMQAKGATLTVTDKAGHTHAVVIPAGTYESCSMGAQYPACK
jgi:hypothetical protein